MKTLLTALVATLVATSASAGQYQVYLDGVPIAQTSPTLHRVSASCEMYANNERRNFVVYAISLTGGVNAGQADGVWQDSYDVCMKSYGYTYQIQASNERLAYEREYANAPVTGNKPAKQRKHAARKSVKKTARFMTAEDRFCDISPTVPRCSQRRY